MSNAPNGLACKDVIMFWRMQEVLRVSAKTLRQQVMYHKGALVCVFCGVRVPGLMCRLAGWIGY